MNKKGISELNIILVLTAAVVVFAAGFLIFQQGEINGLGIVSGYVVLNAPGNISSCNTTINASGEYKLNQSLTGCTGNGIIIDASDVVFDCSGYSISGDSTGTDYGVYVNSGLSNVTVRNCTINNFGETSGAGIYSASSGIIEFNTLNNNCYGIYMVSGSSGVVNDNTVFNSTRDGIYYGTAGVTDITNNTVTNSSRYGINLGSQNFRVWHNNIYNNNLNVYAGTWPDEISYNNEGNYWGHECPNVFTAGTDSNQLTVTDSYPYDTLNGWLYGPVTVCPCFCYNCTDCTSKLNNENCSIVNLANDITSSSTCINNPTNFSNKTFDCQGYTINGTSQGWSDIGVYLYNKHNTTIKDCVITNFGTGIDLNGVSTTNTGHKIIGCDLNNNNYRGAHLYYCSNCLVDDNEIHYNGWQGVYVIACFLEKTKILMADGSYKNIEDVEKGELVASFDEETGSLVDGEVINTFFHEKVNSYLVINNRLKLTANHPMYVNDAWKEAGKIKVGDLLMDKDGNDVAVVSVEVVEEPVPVYNLEVAGQHNYFAEDLLSHNKCPRLFTHDGTEYKFDSLINVGHDSRDHGNVFSYPLKHIKEPKVMLEDDPDEINFVDFIKLKAGDKILEPVSCNCDLSLIKEQDGKYIELDKPLYITFEAFDGESEVEVLSGGYQIMLDRSEPYPDYVAAFMKEYEEKYGHSSYNNITNNNITNNGGEGIHLLLEHYCNLINNTIESNEYGIRFEEASNNTIQDNTIMNSNYSGIFFDYDCLNNIISGGEIGHNNLNNNGNDAGIRIRDGSDSNTISRVYLYDNKYNAIYISESDNNTIESNNIDDNCGGHAGIWLRYTNYTEIMGNNVTNGTGDGIQLEYSYYADVYNNYVANNSYVGIRLYRTSENNFYDNFISENDNHDMCIEQDSFNNSFSDNTISSYPTKISFTYDSSSSFSYFYVDGVENASADPTGYVNISKYVNITNPSGPSWIALNISYSNSDLHGLNESTLKIWKYNGTWNEDGWNGTRVLNTTTNVVGVNITSFGSVFAPMIVFVEPVCGNNIVELGEECESDSNCTETGGHCEACVCYTCGDNVVDPGEECDGTDLAGETCISKGFDSGTLSCLSDCSGYDTSDCRREPAAPSGGGRLIGYIGKTYNVGEEPFTVILYAGDKIVFIVDGVRHTAQIYMFGDSYIILSIASSVEKIRVDLGETETIDVNNDNIDDLLITLNDVSANSADLTFQYAVEEVPVIEALPVVEEVVPPKVEEPAAVEIRKIDYLLVALFLMLVAIASIIILTYYKKHKKK